jgi:hypothetical protein
MEPKLTLADLLAQPQGALSEPQGALASFANAGLLRQFANQRGAYPRQQLNTPQQALDLGAGLLGFVPGVGDAMGLAADLNRYKDDPSSRTMTNFGLTGLGLLPFMPNMTSIKKAAPKVDDYHGGHRPAGPTYGAPLHDLTHGDLIPADIYSSNAVRYYGTGAQKMDAETVRLFNAFRGQPDAQVSIYRAVPKDAPNSINGGDWVTINKDYAKLHGEGPLQGNYKIVEVKVPAKSLWTSLDSIHEFGYHPTSTK